MERRKHGRRQRRAISNKISYLVRNEGLTQKQAVGKALGMARGGYL